MKKLLYIVATLSAGVAIIASAGPDLSRADLRKNLHIFNNTVGQLSDNYVDTLDIEATVRSALDAMLGTIDPYTVYYADSEKDDVMSVSSGEYAGIGLVVSKRDSVIEFIDLQWDGPARRAGVRDGDRLLAIDGTDITAADNIESVRSRLRGKPGTPVSLRLGRRMPARVDTIDLTVERALISIPTVTYAGMINDSIGYIDITTFSNKTYGEFTHALTSLRGTHPLQGLIIDLRGNGGGILEGAVDVISNFVPIGTRVVSTRGRGDHKLADFKTHRKPLDTKLPIAVLVDGNTASAAEILSGALQDLDRAVIIGERTYGKGLVQNVVPVYPSGALKITTGRYYIPSGRLIQAVDYRHRNVDGSAKRIPDSLTNVYATAAGRPVRDGGGISPDVKVEQPESNSFLYSLYADGWLDDFVTLYINGTDTVPDPRTWRVSDAMVADFKTSIDPKKLRRDKTTARTLDYLRELAEIDGYLTDSVKTQLDILSNLLEQNIDRDFEVNHDEIVNMLDTKIADRWWQRGESLRRSLADDKFVKEAVIVLADPRRYGVILSVPASAKKQGK